MIGSGIKGLILGTCLSLLANLSHAQPFPALFDVIDVASNDVLNIRAEPTASSPIIGAFAPDASGIEVIGLTQNGRWARVRAGEAMGWASARFLIQVPRQGDGFGLGLSCFGTEPFWGLNYVPFGASAFSILGVAEDEFDLTPPIQAQGRTDVFGLSGTSDTAIFAGILQRQTCSDGMSDLEYGLSLSVVITGQDSVVYSGCCTLGAN